jgi:hypothetical protein
LADRVARLNKNVWRIKEKGSLATHEFISLVESAVADRKTIAGGDHDVA